MPKFDKRLLGIMHCKHDTYTEKMTGSPHPKWFLEPSDMAESESWTFWSQMVQAFLDWRILKDEYIPRLQG